MDKNRQDRKEQLLIFYLFFCSTKRKKIYLAPNGNLKEMRTVCFSLFPVMVNYYYPRTLSHMGG